MLKDDSLRNELAGHPYPVLFASVGGAHLYGFPSPDSPYDIRGAHLLPLAQIVGLKKGPETAEHSAVREGIKISMATQDLHKFIRHMLKRNGAALEQLFSPLVVQDSPDYLDLAELGKGCITRHLVQYYLDSAETQWKLFQKENPPKVKPLLYVFRTLLTGIHLMQSGEIQCNLLALNQQFRLGFLDDLVSFRLAGAEKGKVEEPRLDLMEKEYRRLLGTLEIEGERTTLPEEPSTAPGLHDLLVRVRLNRA